MYGPSSFRGLKKEVNGIICHDPSELWLSPQLSDDKPNVFHHDSVTPYITDNSLIGSSLSNAFTKQGPLPDLRCY